MSNICLNFGSPKIELQLTGPPSFVLIFSTRDVAWIGTEGAAYNTAELKQLAADLRLQRAADLHRGAELNTDDEEGDDEDDARRTGEQAASSEPGHTSR